MKRSEMIALMLPNFLRAAEGNLIPIEEIDKLVNDCLATMEQFGMLPPDYMSPTGCPCGLPECNAPGIVNEWEEEDKDESGS